MFEILKKRESALPNQYITQAIHQTNQAVLDFNNNDYEKMTMNLWHAMVSVVNYVYANEDIENPRIMDNMRNRLSFADKIWMKKNGQSEESPFAKWVDNDNVVKSCVVLNMMRNNYSHQTGDNIHQRINNTKAINNFGYPCNCDQNGFFSITGDAAEKILSELNDAFDFIIQRMSLNMSVSSGEKQLACMLLLDLSASMRKEGPDGKRPIDELYAAPEIIKEALNACEEAKDVTQYAVITFSDKAEVKREFRNVGQNDDWKQYETGTKTCMNDAILLGLKKIDEQKQKYKKYEGGNYYRPWLIVLTDGKPTDTSREKDAMNQLHDAIQQNSVLYYPIALGNEADIGKLKAYYPEEYCNKGKDEVTKCNVDDLKAIFRWLANSVTYSVTTGNDGIQTPYSAPLGINAVEFHENNT